MKFCSCYAADKNFRLTKAISLFYSFQIDISNFTSKQNPQCACSLSPPSPTPPPSPSPSPWTKILNTMLANEIQQHIKMIIRHDQIASLPGTQGCLNILKKKKSMERITWLKWRNKHGHLDRCRQIIYNDMGRCSWCVIWMNIELRKLSVWANLLAGCRMQWLRVLDLGFCPLLCDLDLIASTTHEALERIT